MRGSKEKGGPLRARLDRLGCNEPYAPRLARSTFTPGPMVEDSDIFLT